MSTGRLRAGRQAKPPGPGDQEPLSVELGKARLRCCYEMDEKGFLGCSACPVERRCSRLWREEVEDNERISVADYRRLECKFARLKKERDGILARRGQKVPQALT